MSEIPLVVWLGLDLPVDVDGARLGGKASALARLVALDQPVPLTAVVTTAAFDAVAATPLVRSLTRRLLESGAGEFGDDEIDRVFLDAPLPADVHAALDELGARFDRRLAVRSSATAEDLVSSAFAGQYRTLLDIEPSDVERAVRLVWASSWHASPRAYRHLRCVDQDEPTMAVVVMEMVDPELAGVLFTRDPVGDESNVRLETVAGQGDALVSGAVTPEAWTWPRHEATLAAARLGPAVGELVERGLDLEAVWGLPLDIEFAIDRAGRLWLLQTRPVTALAATATRPAGPARAGIAEMLPGVLPPLLQETAGRYVDEGFRNLLAGLGADIGAVADRDSFVRFVRSRALLDEALLRRATATVPGGSIAPLEPGAATETTRTSPLQAVRVMRRRRSAVVESEIVVQAVDHVIGRLGRDDRCERDDLAVLLARWERVQDLGARAVAAEMSVAALATAAYEGAQRTLTRYVGPERASELVQQLTARRDGSVGPLDRSVRAIGVDPSQPLTEEVWGEVLARSGSRSVFGGPTWEDDRDLAWMSYSASRQPVVAPVVGTDPLRLVARPSGSRRPRLHGGRRRFVRRELADAAELLDRRERTKRALLDLGGVAHRAALELADVLVAEGALACRDDVWLLSREELRAACAGAGADDLAGVLGERRSELAADRLADTAATIRTGNGWGWPASPGRARGRAVVVDAPRAGAIDRGDVLVAHTTDAGWAPLFSLASAIVVEEGGPLSHAAIVARELGVPAVVNLPGIVEQVRTAGPGTTVEVDGSTGQVTIVDTTPPMRPPSPLAPVIAPPTDEPRLGVFVTGLIGASALFGAVVSITEAVSSTRGMRRTRARAAIPATVVADVVHHGTGAALRATAGLVPARRYARWATALGATGVLAGAIAMTEYATGASPARVVWLVTAISTLSVAMIGAALLRQAAVRWPDVPPIVRRLTPSPRPRTTLRQFWHEMPAFHRRWLTAFATTSVLLLLLNLAAPTALRAIDEELYDWIGSPEVETWGPEWFGMYFGRPQVVIPIALLVALFTVRCRVLAIAYPMTIAFGGLLNLGLGVLGGKDRPPLGEHADQTDSFPSGHAIEVTLLFGLAPLAVAVLLRSRWFGHVLRVVASGLLAVMLVDGLREGSHWPTDHLGGFAIAMTAVVLVHALARMPSLHRSCTRCPTLSLLPGTVDVPRADPP